MYSLLIDSHSSILHIVLYKDKKVKEIEQVTVSNQSKIIVSTIIKLLKRCNINFNDISEVIVVNGPGSFTGIRLGVTIGKTISYCLNIPIKSISTIKLLAINANQNDNYSVTIPDQKGVYIGEFNKRKNILGDYFYIDKKDYIAYKMNHNILENVNISWNTIYMDNYLTETDCYNIKPLYIKKIEVEK